MCNRSGNPGSAVRFHILPDRSLAPVGCVSLVVGVEDRTTVLALVPRGSAHRVVLEAEEVMVAQVA